MILNNISNLMVGSTQATKMYLGSTVVWEKDSGGLPTGYTQVEYIASTSSGGQYIDTGLKMWQSSTISYDIEMKVLPISGSNNYASVIGFNSTPVSGKWTGYCIQRNYNEPSKICKTTNGTVITEYGSLGEELTIKDSMSDLNITDAHDNTTLLFALNNSDKCTMVMRLYYCKISLNGTLVRNFIPCLNSDGVAGLYDTVEGTFYSSASSTEFTYHVSRDLPNGYTQVEYIASTATGGQYIDLGLQMWKTAPISYALDMKINLIGNGKDNHNQCVVLGANKEVSPWPGFVIRRSTNLVTQDQNPYVNNYGSLNTIVTINQSQTNLNVNTHSETTTLFCGLNGSGTPFRFSETQMYYCKIWSQEELVRDLIPCINSQSVAGLYDLANGVFYPSQGDEPFIYSLSD